MKDTRYVEPTGLSSKNQSSAQDLAKLVNVAHADANLRELSTSPNHEVAVGDRTLQYQQYQPAGEQSALGDRPAKDRLYLRRLVVAW